MDPEKGAPKDKVEDEVEVEVESGGCPSPRTHGEKGCGKSQQWWHEPLFIGSTCITVMSFLADSSHL